MGNIEVLLHNAVERVNFRGYFKWVVVWQATCCILLKVFQSATSVQTAYKNWHTLWFKKRLKTKTHRS